MCGASLVINPDETVVDTEDPWAVESRHVARVIAGPPGGFDLVDWDAIAAWGPELVEGYPAPVEHDPVPPDDELSPAEGDPVPPAAGLSPKALLDELAALEQQIGAAQARQVDLLAGLSRQRHHQATVATVDPDVVETDYWHEQVADEVAARVCWTRWQADHRVQEARRLLECLPQTLVALGTGQVDYPRVRVIVRATEHLDPASAAAVDAAVADRAGTLTTAALREVLAREVLAVDPDAARRREQAAAAERGVFVAPLPDSQAELRVTGPAADVAGIAEGLDTLAGPFQGSGGHPLGARRFDALLAAVADAADRHDAQSHPGNQETGVGGQTTHGTGDPAEPGARRRTRLRAQVLVAISLNTLIGLDNHPAELVGYGPLPAHIARQIARDGVLRRLLTDPVTGALVNVDGHTHPDGFTPDPPDDTGPPDTSPPDTGPRDTDPPDDDASPDHATAARVTTTDCPVATTGGGPYRPRTALDRLVRLRDQVCSAMSCRRRADTCDLDHMIAHPEGPTCACNLHPLCRRHHLMKHRTTWHVTALRDGSRLWTSPTGHTYLAPARPFLEQPQVIPPNPAQRDAARPHALLARRRRTAPSEPGADPGPPPF